MQILPVLTHNLGVPLIGCTRVLPLIYLPVRVCRRRLLLFVTILCIFFEITEKTFNKKTKKPKFALRRKTEILVFRLQANFGFLFFWLKLFSVIAKKIHKMVTKGEDAICIHVLESILGPKTHTKQKESQYGI